MSLKLNLIIDGNYILSRLVFTLNKNNLLYGSLYSSLDNTIINFRKMYPFSNIYLVSDSKEKSWRRDINKDYKSSRKKDSDIDWSFVYDTYIEFKKNTTCKVLEYAGIEGDDWISYITHSSNINSYSNMIISNDHDIKQLLKHDAMKGYINFMTNEMYIKGKIFMPKNWKIFYDVIKKSDEGDIFNLNDNIEFIKLIDLLTNKYDVVEVDPINSLLLKIISGDTSDNIKSVHQVNKNGKVRGIGAKGAESILNSYSIEFGYPDFKDPDLLDNIADLIIEKKKLPNRDMHIIIENLKKNITMVDLSLSSIPKDIVEKMKTEYDKI